MVVAAFPVAKLGAILLKQVSKPIANFAKERAKNHPFFRKYVCMPPAQFYNWCEIQMKMWVLNLGRPVEVPKLNEAMAIELGANLLGESIIFIIAAALLYSEYARSVRKELAKDEAKAKEMSDLQQSLKELYFVSEKQSAQINELMREINYLDSKLAKVRPFAPIPKPPSSSPPELSTPQISSNKSDKNDNIQNPGLIIAALDYVTFALPNKTFENN